MKPETRNQKPEASYMHRCIELAENGLGSVAPNPMVGCVIVNNGKIIGEGYHQKYGEAHAEVNAINSVKEKSLLRASTLYVNLEPCCYHGKTPPCTDLIIRHKIPDIVIGCTDPAPKVAGKGIEQLQKAKCKVIYGILENECKELNRRFFTYHDKKRPYIILKWAQTLDGFIAAGNVKTPNGSASLTNHLGVSTFRVSNELSRMLLHKWRSEEMAIMVGTNTAHIDNPQLNVREWFGSACPERSRRAHHKWSGKNPVRVVLDRTLRLSKDLHLFDNSVSTFVYTACERKSDKNLEYIPIDFKKNIIPQILEGLYNREIQSVIVEGGAQLLNSFIKNDIWDEMRVFTGNKIFGNGIKAPASPTPPTRAEAALAGEGPALPKGEGEPTFRKPNMEFTKEDIDGDCLLIIRKKQ